MTTMKLFLTTLAAIGVALTDALVASADEDMYLTELRQKVAYPLTDAQAFQLGQVACNALREGINSGLSMGQSRHQADQAVGQAQNGMGLQLSMADGMFLTEAAEHQLC